jgi:hypothetical protein
MNIPGLAETQSPVYDREYDASTEALAREWALKDQERRRLAIEGMDRDQAIAALMRDFEVCCEDARMYLRKHLKAVAEKNEAQAFLHGRSFRGKVEKMQRLADLINGGVEE